VTYQKRSHPDPTTIFKIKKKSAQNLSKNNTSQVYQNHVQIKVPSDLADKTALVSGLRSADGFRDHFDSYAES
jgi:hypothetical protein